MGWRGTAAKEVELSKSGPDAAAVGSGSGWAESGVVDVLADTEAPEIVRKIEELVADSSEWILEGPEAGIRVGSGRM